MYDFYNTDFKFIEVNLYSKNSFLIYFEAYIVIVLFLGIYKLGLSSIYLKENLATPKIIEKRTIEEKI